MFYMTFIVNTLYVRVQPIGHGIFFLHEFWFYDSARLIFLNIQNVIKHEKIYSEIIIIIFKFLNF